MPNSDLESARSIDPQELQGAVAGAAAGVAIAALGRRRGGALGAVLSLAGGVGFAVALAPVIRRAIMVAGARQRRVKLRRTVHVPRPLDEVFAFCKDFENFVGVLGPVRRVVDHQDGRSHWELESPAGRIIEWDARVTKYVPNVVIGWESVAGSPVETCGVIRFAPAAGGGTTLRIEFEYEPHETDLRDALHALLGRRRERTLERDIVRIATSSA